jgi:S-adenosyl methyltransferase
VHSVRANRKFLARAVRLLARDEGIRQFLDVGTGIPSADNTHEVAQRFAPQCRIVYVDNDRCKSGCAHARASSVAGSRLGDSFHAATMTFAAGNSPQRLDDTSHAQVGL